ncbi:MAG: sugar transferase [Oscillospiraceae bacterium]
MTHKPKGIYEKFIKRILDFCLSLLAVVALSPLLLITAILVRIKLGSPLIFKQERPGRNEKIFKLYKFRTMTNGKNENGELLPDEIRLTKFGQLLRSTSIDELPELINILKGDMSIIGPRPLLVQYLDLYNDFQKRRHEVLPGLTGLAQACGRNSNTWEKKFNLDIQYVDNITFCNDLKILFKTIGAVVKKEGISSETSSTMEVFTGIQVEGNTNE